jgi:tetratricopeptide (TPR) repeat protein
VKVLRSDPGSECAIAGLAGINAPLDDPTSTEVQELCQHARVLEDANLRTDALETYQTALEKNPASDCAISGIASTAKDAAALCLQADRLADEKDDEAKSLYMAAQDLDPSAECASTGLEELDSEDGFGHKVDSVVDDLTDAGVTLLKILGVLLVLAILASIGLRWVDPAYRWLIRYRFFSWLIGPRLSLADIDASATNHDKIGAPFTARLQERLQRFRWETHGGASSEAERADIHDLDLDLGTGDEEFVEIVTGDAGLQNSLDKVSELGSHAKIVAALINLLSYLLPTRRLKVSGVLDPADRAGTAITVSLQESSRLRAASVVHGPPLSADPTAADYLTLADPTAAWVQYAVAQAVRSKRVDPSAADSHAHLRRGLELQLAGDATAARDAYRDAIEKDAENWAARVNMSVVAARLGDYPGSVGNADAALEDIAGQQGNGG